jgi:hypothetical protein
LIRESRIISVYGELRPWARSIGLTEYEVDIASLDQAASETSFLKASFELLKEVAGLTALTAGLMTEETKSGPRSQ